MEETQGFRRADRRLMMRSVAFVLSAAVVSGCTALPSSLHLVQSSPVPAESVALAVVAAPKVVQQNGASIPGIVAQAVFMDKAGTALSSDASLYFALYANENAAEGQVEPDVEWRFTADQVRQATALATIGTVHNFWLPLKGELAEVGQLRLLTVAKQADGRVLTRWNSVSMTPPDSRIEHTTEPVHTAAEPLPTKSR